jgi:hypothetical protein
LLKSPPSCGTTGGGKKYSRISASLVVNKGQRPSCSTAGLSRSCARRLSGAAVPVALQLPGAPFLHFGGAACISNTQRQFSKSL